jgi:hypothetical protein
MLSIKCRCYRDIVHSVAYSDLNSGGRSIRRWMADERCNGKAFSQQGCHDRPSQPSARTEHQDVVHRVFPH